jgi:hypothetical protein
VLARKAVKNVLIKTINSLGVSSKYIGTPKAFISTEDWVKKNNKLAGTFFKEIHPAKSVTEKPPITIEESIPKAFKDEYNRIQPQAFVAGIPMGRVWGRNGAVVTPDDLLLGDISREFGKQGGKFREEHSIFDLIKLPSVRFVKGRVAVVACAGSFNYFHWLYDTLPRIGLLKQAGLFDSIDYFVIDYLGSKFQKDSLEVLGVPVEKIISCDGDRQFHLQAEELIITSLPSNLGSTSDWTVKFLRDTFLKNDNVLPQRTKNIYLSRKKATLRFLINEQEILDLLAPYNFAPFYAEDHSISETAKAFSECNSVVGVHGAGFANLSFCSPQTKVIDIIAPKHFDTNFWILSNHAKADFAYIFGEGERLPEDTDLIKNKINEDIYVNPESFKTLLKKLQF